MAKALSLDAWQTQDSQAQRPASSVASAIGTWPRPASAAKKTVRDFALCASQTRVGDTQRQINRHWINCSIQRRTAQELHDHTILMALALRPHKDGPEHTLDTRQRPADFLAGVTLVEYPGGDRNSWWKMSLKLPLVGAPEDKHNRYNALKLGVRAALVQAFSHTSDVSKIDIRVARVQPLAGSHHELEVAFEVALPLAPRAPSFDDEKPLATTAQDIATDCVEAPGFAERFCEALRSWFLQTPREAPEDARARSNSLRAKLHGGIDPSQVKVWAEHPSEVKLRGGAGEPVFVASLPDASRPAWAGVCEGFELVVVDHWDTSHRRWMSTGHLEAFRTDEILSRRTLQAPARLGFRSPLWKLPNLSERQLAEKLGLRQVRQFHLYKLIDELSYVWKELTVTSKEALRRLQAAVDEALLITEPIEVGQRMLKEGWRVRAAKAQAAGPGVSLTREGLGKLLPPARLEVGRPRSPQTVQMKELETALRAAGIHWLNRQQQVALLEALRPSAEDIDQNGEDAWQMTLADRFVIDSAGLYSQVGRTVQAVQIHSVTEALQERLAQRRDEPGFDGTLSFKDFQESMFRGGIQWLTHEQLVVLYDHIRGGNTAHTGMTLTDWVQRFSWDPMEAMQEIQRRAEIWLEEEAERARQRKTPAPRNPPMTFSDFQRHLMRLGVTWLTAEQERLVFDTTDEDGSGLVDEAELLSSGQRRKEVEQEREEIYGDRDLLNSWQLESFRRSAGAPAVPEVPSLRVDRRLRRS